MVIQNQRQIPALIQIRKHRRNPAGKIGKDKNFPFLFINLFQHFRIWLFQRETLDCKSLPFQCAGEYGARGKPIGIIVVKDLNGLFRHLPEFPNSLFHRVN